MTEIVRKRTERIYKKHSKKGHYLDFLRELYEKYKIN